MRSTCASLRGRRRPVPLPGRPLLNPAATGAGQRVGSVTGAVREVHGLSPLALERRLRDLLAAAIRPAGTRLTSHPVPATRKGGHPGAVGAGAAPSTSDRTATRRDMRTGHNGRKPAQHDQ